MRYVVMRPQIPMKRIGAKEEKSYCKKTRKKRGQ